MRIEANKEGCRCYSQVMDSGMQVLMTVEGLEERRVHVAAHMDLQESGTSVASHVSRFGQCRLCRIPKKTKLGAKSLDDFLFRVEDECDWV